eukprot:CAMPEP_0172316506 /NCGR_PEP_ID=MMETSP1058-20130122/28448_1 /TAXON_ID=83371 /ORGANISM="Detonula confervacea, Strain CCMP 353" /LENGTH=390 /DNA_ID=CAMNT_0013030825 /DNA_START=27 /DNA_END=1199 /DNA_ORIENTATION=-
MSSAPSSPQHSLHDDRANRGIINVQIASSLSLSLNPSMVGSSMLIPPETNANRSWIELNQAALSQSSVSTSDMSAFAASDFTPCYTPDVCLNIGRSIMLASSASSDTHVSENACDALSKSSGVTESVKGTKWWDRLQTDEDWDDFRRTAGDYLNALIIEEMKELKRNEESSGTGSSVDKTAIAKESTQRNNEGFSKVRQWLPLQIYIPMQILYESINAAIADITSTDDTKTKYFSSLIKEIVDVQQQLGRLPPIPPTLPLDDMSLDDLPSSSRDALVQYNIDLDEWKEKGMPQQEELSAKYVQCQEKLLAAIIDTEEELFYDNKDECNSLGTVNDDGYIEVVEKESSRWDDVNEALVTSQSKCQLTLGAAFVAALTAGAGFLLTLQSKRR